MKDNWMFSISFAEKNTDFCEFPDQKSSYIWLRIVTTRLEVNGPLPTPHPHPKKKTA